MSLRDRHYEQFTPRERLALLFDALARKDYPEADRLADTCERKRYWVHDAAYIQGVQHVHLSCLHAILMIREAELRATAAGVSMLLAPENDSERKGKGMSAYISSQSEILGIWEAWQEFCATVGADPRSVMQACWGDVPRVVKECPPVGSNLDKLIPADSAAKESALALFMSRWEELQSQHAT